MSESLFRKEVLEKRSRRLTGDLVVKTSVPARMLVIFLSTTVLVAIIYLASNTYTRKQTVAGLLMPDKGLIDVFPAVNGRISQIHIEQGELLEQGQVLLTVAEDHGQLQSSPVMEVLSHNLKHEKQLVREQIQRLSDAHEITVEKHNIQFTALTRGLAQEKRVLDAELAMLEIQTKSLSRANWLAANQALSDSDLDAREYEVLAQRTRIETRKGEILTLEHALDQEIIALRESNIRYQERRNLLEQQLNGIAAEAISIEARERTEVVAPVSGIVSRLNVYRGMAVSTQQSLLSLLPEDSLMQAWLQVPASAIGFVRKGQTVKIRYSAFAYQKFGVFEGTITLVPDNADLVTTAGGEPFYQVVAEIGMQSVAAYGEEFPLRAGTSLSADIILDRRNLLEWLLEPLYSIGLRS